MNLVQPIRDKKKIECMKKYLMKSNYRDYLLFVTGINTGLRVSDLLKLRVSDIRNKTHITLIEEKTEKPKRFKINNDLRKDIDKYIKDMEDNQFLFKSRNGENEPLSRVRAWKILKDAAKKCNIQEVGTHTLRKTFGYWHYQIYKDVAILQDIFNHSAPSITLRYIGINQDMKDKTIEDFYL